MAQIVWSESALQDLHEIAEYIALDKTSAAKSLVKEIFKSVDLLEQFPESGRVPPELDPPTRYREIIKGPCRIFYRYDQEKVFIVYVMRSERMLRNYIIDDSID